MVIFVHKMITNNKRKRWQTTSIRMETFCSFSTFSCQPWPTSSSTETCRGNSCDDPWSLCSHLQINLNCAEQSLPLKFTFMYVTDIKRNSPKRSSLTNYIYSKSRTAVVSFRIEHSLQSVDRSLIGWELQAKASYILFCVSHTHTL